MKNNGGSCRGLFFSERVFDFSRKFGQGKIEFPSKIV